MEAWLADALAKAGDEQAMPLSGPIPAVVPRRVLSLDGDYLAYFMAGNDDTDAGTARRNALARIEQFREMAGCVGTVMHLSASGGTKADRFLIATSKPYQGNRDGAKRPKNWAALREFFESYKGKSFTPKIWWDREADDGMAYMQAKAIAEGRQDEVVTCTRDKDMRQYPGWHINWMTYQLHWVDPSSFSVVGPDDLLYGHKWFWLQCLHGDTADAIPGLPSYIAPNGKKKPVGEVTANQLLADVTSDEEAFQKLAVLYGGTFLGEWGEKLAEQMLLLWLRRDKDATYGDCLRHLKLDRSTDNFKDLLQGFLAIKQRVEQMKAEVLAIEANNFSTQTSKG